LEEILGKLNDSYELLKDNDSNKLYLFESGKFCIFLNDDAKYISSITTLKLIYISSDCCKCGFPNNAIDKYMNIFNNLNLNISIVKSLNYEDIYYDIKGLLDCNYRNMEYDELIILVNKIDGVING
jgi:DNA mismatch repair ATPase MutS